MAITVRDLPENPPCGVILYCPSCGARSSAMRDDYFWRRPDLPFRCDSDRSFLQLVRAVTRYEDWSTHNG